MTQSDVLKLLKEKSRWITSKEICETLGIMDSSCNTNLNKLFKQGLILRKQEKKQPGIPYYYQIK